MKRRGFIGIAAVAVLMPSVVSAGAAARAWNPSGYDPLRPFPIVRDFPAHLQDGHRRFQACPSVTVSPKGRVWASWMTGDHTEGEENFTVVATSADGGLTWSKPLYRVRTNPPERSMDGGLWTAPDGKVWFFHSQIYSFWDGRGGVWASHPVDAEDPAAGWTVPRRLADGFFKNKPIVTSWGEWLFPFEFMQHAPKRGTYPHLKVWEGLPVQAGEEFKAANVFASTDGGASFWIRGRAKVPPSQFAPFENMVVERRDGSLWMLVRTAYGIGESVSTDRGRTWTDVVPSKIPSPSSRFFVGRLRSGALLLVKNGPMDRRTDRREIRAFVSDDDGETWTGGLMLDPRYETSYPDAAEAPDGFIHVVNDRNRCTTAEILHHRFTEADVRAGRLVTPGSKLMNLVSCHHLERPGEAGRPQEGGQVWKAAAE